MVRRHSCSILATYIIDRQGAYAFWMQTAPAAPLRVTNVSVPRTGTNVAGLVAVAEAHHRRGNLAQSEGRAESSRQYGEANRFSGDLLQALTMPSQPLRAVGDARGTDRTVRISLMRQGYKLSSESPKAASMASI